MGDEKKVLRFEIAIKEETSWGLVYKSFSNNYPNVDRAHVIVEVVEYLSGNFHEDYVKAEIIVKEKQEIKVK